MIKYITGIILNLLFRPNSALDLCRAILLTRTVKILGGFATKVARRWYLKISEFGLNWKKLF